MRKSKYKMVNEVKFNGQYFILLQKKVMDVELNKPSNYDGPGTYFVPVIEKKGNE